MKKYEITWYYDGVKHSRIIMATSRREALQKAWCLVDVDDIYVEEIKE